MNAEVVQLTLFCPKHYNSQSFTRELIQSIASRRLSDACRDTCVTGVTARDIKANLLMTPQRLMLSFHSILSGSFSYGCKQGKFNCLYAQSPAVENKSSLPLKPLQAHLIKKKKARRTMLISKYVLHDLSATHLVLARRPTKNFRNSPGIPVFPLTTNLLMSKVNIVLFALRIFREPSYYQAFIKKADL